MSGKLTPIADAMATGIWLCGKDETEWRENAQKVIDDIRRKCGVRQAVLVLAETNGILAASGVTWRLKATWGMSDVEC